MKREDTFWILTVIVGFFLQIVISNYGRVFGTYPNLLLIGTIFFAILRGSMVGVWIGFFWGLFSDILSISLFGSQTFMFTLIGYCTGKLQGKINEEKFIAQIFLVLFMAVFYLFGLILFETLFGGSRERYRILTSFLQPIYSALISPFFFMVLMKWSSWFHKTELKIGIR